MKIFLSLLVSFLFAFNTIGQNQPHSVDAKVISIEGTKELIFNKTNGCLIERWISHRDTFSINHGIVSGYMDSANIGRIKVRIYKWHTSSGVMPEYYSDTIFSSDTNKIKPIRIIYK